MYHSGELAIQRRLGVASEAARMEKTVRREIPSVARHFVDEGHFVALALRGADGFPALRIGAGHEVVRVVGPSEVEVDLAHTVGSDDDLQLSDGAVVGMIVIDFATRRRMRLNGHVALPENGLPIVVADAVYSNCHKYIQQRRLRDGTHDVASASVVSDALSDAAMRLIATADTFFIGTAHPKAGADANHRGGAPGFVEVLDRRHLRWPDYPGNRMYQTLGNIIVDDRVGLGFLDFETGAAAFVQGRVAIVFDSQGSGERIQSIDLTVERVTTYANAGLARYDLIAASPHNPPVEAR